MSFNDFKNLIESFCFSEIGLNFVSHTLTEKKDKLYPDEKVVSYRSIYRNEFIEISFNFYSDIDAIYITIIKSPSEYFNIEEYLVEKNKPNDLKKLKKTLNESPIQYLKRYIEFAIELFKTDLKPIIEGKTWEQVNHDWMGYK